MVLCVCTPLNEHGMENQVHLEFFFFSCLETLCGFGRDEVVEHKRALKPGFQGEMFIYTNIIEGVIIMSCLNQTTS